MTRLPAGSVVLLLLLLVLTSTAAATSRLPPSFVLLPLSSFVNFSLIAPYNCDPVLSFHSCNGRGDCHLLLDSNAAYAQPFLNASTTQPTPACDTSLETKNIDSTTPLPAAVCLCHAGYTGRGDYINHYAMDGDSCGVYVPAVVALSSLGIVTFTLVLLLALHRLYRWSLWHAASTADTAHVAGGTHSSEVDSFQSSEDNITHNNTGGSEANANLPAPSPATQNRSTSRAADNTPLSPVLNARSPSFHTDTPTAPPRIVRGHHRSPTIGGHIRLHARPATADNSAIIVKTKARKRQLLYRHLNHITFLHPLLSIAVSLISIVYFVVRISTDWTLGSSYVMSVLVYLQSVPFMLACSLAVLNTLRAASAITRTQTGVKGLSNVNRAAKRCLLGLCVYAAIVCVLFILVRADNADQQLMAQLSLCLCYTPISVLGLVSVVATRRITNSLVQHLDLLSSQQQQDRLDVCRKLRRQSHILAFLLIGNTVISFILALQPTIRQVGVPYFALLTHSSTAVILAIRLLLLRPHSTTKHSVAPAPVLLTSPTQLNRLLTASEVRVDGKGSTRPHAVSGSSGSGGSGGNGGSGADGCEMSVVVRTCSPSRWGRTMSARGPAISAGSGTTIVGSEQSSHTRASSDNVAT